MSESENSSTAASQSQCDELAAAVLRYCEANHFKIAAAESVSYTHLTLPTSDLV